MYRTCIEYIYLVIHNVVFCVKCQHYHAIDMCEYDLLVGLVCCVRANIR